jgi:hypothetical protein
MVSKAETGGDPASGEAGCEDWREWERVNEFVEYDVKGVVMGVSGGELPPELG